MPIFVTRFRLVTILFIHCVLGLLDLEELANIQYAIDILDKPLLLNEDSQRDGVVLSSRYGQLYQCQYEAVTNGDGVGPEEEDVVKTKVVDLLKPMEDEPCLVLNTGWWTYEFCYKKNIQQYHFEEGKIAGDVISLGHYASEFSWNDSQLKSRPEYAARYHSQEYTNGSVCDLTGELRSTSVRFKCQNGINDGIEGVEEPTTCTYIITIHTNKLCQHPELRILSQKKCVPITCQPLLNDEEYAHYEEFHAKDAAKDEATAVSSSELDRETTEDQPGTTSKREESFFIMAETAEDIGSSNDELKRVIVGKIVKKLKNSMDSAQGDDDNFEEQDQDVREEYKQENEVTLQRKKKEQNREEKMVPDINKDQKHENNARPAKLKDASSELNEALEGILSMVNSKFKTIVDETVEEEDEEYDDGHVNAGKMETGIKLSTKKEDDDKESSDSDDIPVMETESQKKEETDAEKQTDAEYITWQGQGNQIQQITIDNGMKVHITQKKKDDEEKGEKSELEDTKSNKLTSTKPTTSPGRKMEVRIINAAYYNKDGKPVADDPNPSIERMVIALLQRNDEEVAEFEKQKRIEENYRFKWSKISDKKETDVSYSED